MELPSVLVMLLTYFVEVDSFRKQFVDSFNNVPSSTFYPEDATLLLYCKGNTTMPIGIYNSGKPLEPIVISSELHEEYVNDYNFTVVNSSTALFTIKTLQVRQNNIQFTCQMKETLYFHIQLFKPIEVRDPRCSSSLGSRYIFEDLIKSHIEFNCTSEEGDPPVKMSAYIRNGTEINDITKMSNVTYPSHPYPSKTLIFSSNLTSSFNNTVFVCNVSQQLPEQYQSYRGSCSFGPLLLLPSFSVSVIPSNITVNESDDVILTCGSNVSKVSFNWSNIPSDWKTDIKPGSNFSELHITDYGLSITSVIVECAVTFGDRAIKEHVNIRVVRRHGSASAIRYVIICVVVIIVIVALIFLLVYRYRNNTTKCLENIRRKRFFDKNNSSMNNSNEDNNIGKTDEKLRREDDLSSSLRGGPLMIDNTIYESSNVDKQDSAFEMTSTKCQEFMDQDCQMVENSIYESTSVNVEKQQSWVNPEYDTLQPDVHHV